MNNRKSVSKNNTIASIYINPNIFLSLGTKIILEGSYSTNRDDFMSPNKSNLKLAITGNPLEAIELKNKNNCDICFINNHGNDYVDFTPTYEMSIETAPKALQKLLTSHQNGLKNNEL